MPKRLNHRKLLEQETAFAERTNQFRSGKLFAPSIYAHLQAFGVEIGRSLILSWFPDGEGTLIVDVLRQDGVALRFDTTEGSGELSVPNDVSDRFQDRVRRNAQKPWITESIAWRVFLSSSR